MRLIKEELAAVKEGPAADKDEFLESLRLIREELAAVKERPAAEKDKFLAGEMMLDVKYPTIGEELDGRATATFRKIELINRTSVYGVVIKDDGNTANFYCYLRNISGSWKIEAGTE